MLGIRIGLNIDRSRVVLRNVLEITKSIINDSRRLNRLRSVDECWISRIDKRSFYPIT